MAGPTVTADMVLEVSQISRERAERIATYATLRFGGLSMADAAHEVELTDRTVRKYEKWLPLLRAQFDLPDPAKPAHSVHDFEAHGNHIRWHVKREVVSPDCPLCWDGTP